MANPPQGTMSFPGIDQIVRGSYTLSHGISPGVATIECAPQANFEAQAGDLVIAMDDGSCFIDLPNCIVDKHSIRTNSQGQVWLLNIQDRRWMWKVGGGEIDGHYNILQDDGSIDPSTAQTPQQLATLCLQALNEVGFDVSAMPNFASPQILWEAINPAQALADLADLFGSRVILGIDNNVRIIPTGQGQDLPTGGLPIMENSLSINLPIQPDSLQVTCGKTRYQPDLFLMPVGQDVDYSIKPISQLTYAPSGGWGNEDPFSFSNVSDSPDMMTGLVPQDLALKTVWRWFQIQNSGTANGGSGDCSITIPGYANNPVTSLKQLLPIEDVLVVTRTGADGLPQSLPAQVWGTFWDGNEEYEDQDQPNLFRGSFTINKDKGIVEFDEPMVSTETGTDGTSQTWVQPDIWLRTAVSVQDATTRAWDRYRVQTQLQGQQYGTGPRILLHDEIVRQIYPSYDAEGDPTGQLNDNVNSVNDQVNYYLQAAMLEYQIPTPYDIQYGWLVPIQPDGAIQQVTWSVGREGAITRASKNNEYHPYLPSYKERRNTDRLAGFKLSRAADQAMQQLCQKS